MYRLLVLTVFATAAIARQFNNPLMEREIIIPSPVKYKDSYYLIDEFVDRYPGTFTMLVSKDLQYWQAKQVKLMTPETDLFLRIEEPSLHVIADNQFRIYYGRYYQGYTNVSALYATDILGPYYVSEKPVINVRETLNAPTLFNAYGVLYMAWEQGYYPNVSIHGQRLLSDGLSADENEPVEVLLTSTLSWEDEVVISPYIIQKGDYFYLFYNGIMYCYDAPPEVGNTGIGVARSLFPLGPYEKFGDPILQKNAKFKTPRYPNIIKDIDNETDVLLYGCHKTTADCMNRPFPYICASSITWSKDNWPIIQN